MDLQLETFSQRNVELVPSVELVPLPNNTELTQYYIQNCTLSYQIQGTFLSCIECSKHFLQNIQDHLLAA